MCKIDLYSGNMIEPVSFTDISGDRLLLWLACVTYQFLEAVESRTGNKLRKLSLHRPSPKDSRITNPTDRVPNAT
jgi:hypothetical protein